MKTRVIAIQKWEKLVTESRYSVTMWARELGVSVRQLERDARAALGQTSRAWLRALRLQRARALVRARTGTIKDCAGQLGYMNTAHFSHDFKKQFGEPPSKHGAASRFPPLPAECRVLTTDCRVLTTRRATTVGQP